MLTTSAETATPRIEGLLAAAHRNYTMLKERRRVLERSGIDHDHLPVELDVMAFALVGDHERDVRLAQVRPRWAALQSKGHVYGAIDDVTTAELRLIAHAQEHTESIGSLWQQLRDAQDTREPPHGIWRSATRVRGMWGQKARLHFSVQDVQHLLIDPDPVFGLQAALLALDPDTCHTGSFPFPIDHGAITIRLRHRNERLSVHRAGDG